MNCCVFINNVLTLYTVAWIIIRYYTVTLRLQEQVE